jgi:hypothetical protein
MYIWYISCIFIWLTKKKTTKKILSLYHVISNKLDSLYRVDIILVFEWYSSSIDYNLQYKKDIW